MVSDTYANLFEKGSEEAPNGVKKWDKEVKEANPGNHYRHPGLGLSGDRWETLGNMS